MTDRIRLTISVSPEVHAVFLKMSEVSGMSLGKCMGDWLADTAEGAQFVSMKMEEARKAPKTVMREFQAMARGLVAEVDAQVETIRKNSLAEGSAAKAQPRRAAHGQAFPPSSNTGGKLGGKTLTKADGVYSGLAPNGQRVLLNPNEFFDKSGVLQVRKPARKAQ